MYTNIYEVQQFILHNIQKEIKECYIGKSENSPALHLGVKSIEINSDECKNYEYIVNFQLNIIILNRYFTENEQNLYNMLESVLKFIRSVDFLFYGVSNNNIKAITKTGDQSEPQLTITATWESKLKLSSW